MTSSIRFLRLEKSPIKIKKWRAFFEKDGEEVHSDFGSSLHEDFTQHRNAQRRARYWQRHQHDKWRTDPMSPGALSWWLLWGQYPDLERNVGVYRKYFGI